MLQLSEEGWKVLQQIFDIDYMGAAEFEFGALLRCLQELAQDHEKLTTFRMVLPKKEIEPSYCRGVRPRKGEKKVEYPDMKDGVVYVICRKEHAKEVEAVIRKLAKRELRLKESSNFQRALDPIEEFDSRCIGWLELDNGFFFFVDYEAYAKTAELFGQKPVDAVETK